MPRGCDHDVHVRIVHKERARHFIVEFNADGEVLRIKERRMKDYAPMGVPIGEYNATYWVATSHVLGTGNTLPKRIIAAARAKLMPCNDTP